MDGGTYAASAPHRANARSSASSMGDASSVLVGMSKPLGANHIMKFLRVVAGVGLVAAPFVAARADLILVSPNIVALGGTGLGAVNTSLTIQSQGSSSTETGCVAFTGSGDQLGAA